MARVGYRVDCKSSPFCFPLTHEFEIDEVRTGVVGAVQNSAGYFYTLKHIVVCCQSRCAVSDPPVPWGGGMTTGMFPLGFPPLSS